VKDKIKVGIIGAGWAGQTHAKFYRRLPWVEIAGWADVIVGKAKEAAAEYEVPASAVYQDYKEMFDKVELDVVSVCSFNM